MTEHKKPTEEAVESLDASPEHGGKPVEDGPKKAENSPQKEQGEGVKEEGAPAGQADQGEDGEVGTSGQQSSGGESAEEPTEASEGQEEGDDDDLADDLFLSPDDDDVEIVDLTEEPSPESGAEDADQQQAQADDGALREAQAKIEELSGAITSQAQRIDELEKSLEELQSEKEEINNRMLRTAADLENYRRRSEREKEELKRYGIDKVVSELIPAVDNMERALQHAESQGETGSLVEGIAMVHRQIQGALKKHGIEGFDSKGESFDPQRHEAIQQVESTEHDTGTIIEEYQKGYFLHDRLLRPALVVVAKRVDPPQNEEVESSSEDEGSQEQVVEGEVETDDGMPGESSDSEESGAAGEQGATSEAKEGTDEE